VALRKMTVRPSGRNSFLLPHLFAGVGDLGRQRGVLQRQIVGMRMIHRENPLWELTRNLISKLFLEGGPRFAAPSSCLLEGGGGLRIA